MDTVLKYKLPFHVRFFLYLMLLFGLFLISFLVFQQHREKTFKAEMVNSRLQIFNTQLYSVISDPAAMDSLVLLKKGSLNEDLRITIMDTLGNVLYDSEKLGPLNKFHNHSDRHEVKQALASGNGFTVRRLSGTTDIEYFYSATRYEGVIIRSAIPYSDSLRESLRADRLFLLVMTGISLFVSLLALILTRRLGNNINRLRKFALLADRGDPIKDIGSFPKDELGEISNHIIRLYSRLKLTKEALESEHGMVLHQKQEQTRLRKQLTQNINHELKTPVSSIQGYLETLVNNPGIPEAKRQAFIESSYKQSNRLAQLLNDISTITRMDEASEIIEKSEINLSDIIRDVFADLSRALQEKKIKTVIDIPQALIMNGNHNLLHSVFRNLTDNAIAYSGCDTLFVSLKESDEDHFQFVYADNGIGIEDEHLPRIFERFYRVDTGRSRLLGGTGLGLSIVKNAIVLHGGTITAGRRDGGGIAFCFSLKRK